MRRIIYSPVTFQVEPKICGRFLDHTNETISHYCCFYYLAASLKVNHPTEVILKVEADAKPIKTHRTGHKPTAHTVSRNQRKNKALPTVSRNNLKDERSKAKSAPPHYHPQGVTGKTTPAMSHNPLKGRRIETTPAQSRSPLKGVTGKTKPPMSRNRTKAGQNKTTLAPSQHHSEGVAENTSTSAASRNPVKVKQGTATQSASRKTMKGVASPTDSKTAQAASHNAVTIEQETTEPAKSQNLFTSELRKELKSKDASAAKSAMRISATPARIIYTSTTQLLPKQSQINKLVTSPGSVNISARAVFSSTLHALKKQSLAKNKTALLPQGRSEMLTSAFLNSAVKVEPSTQVASPSTTTEHSIQHKPRLVSSLIFNSKASTSVSRNSGKYGVGNDENNDSPVTAGDLGSCNESKILQDVSTPNGTETALGPVTDMRTCIQLACDVGGDVAYMRSSQCFVITCHSPALCDTSDRKAGSSDITTSVALLRKQGQSNKGRLY